LLGGNSHSCQLVAAARALLDIETLSAEQVATKAMTIAADMCVHTNHNFLVELLDSKEGESGEPDPSAAAMD
jgi:ATP-dependent HslUV protease, peptidase subunit HslV